MSRTRLIVRLRASNIPYIFYRHWMRTGSFVDALRLIFIHCFCLSRVNRWEIKKVNSFCTGVKSSNWLGKSYYSNGVRDKIPSDHKTNKNSMRWREHIKSEWIFNDTSQLMSTPLKYIKNWTQMISSIFLSVYFLKYL